jgi:hypothetical protein
VSHTAYPTSARLSDGSLLQLHEEQDEDRPDPDSYWKLRRPVRLAETTLLLESQK